MRNYAPTDAAPRVETPLADAIARYERKGYLVVWVRPAEALLVKPRAFQWATFVAGAILTVGVLGALYLVEFWTSRDRIVRLTLGTDGTVTFEETRERPGVVQPNQPV